MLQHSARATKFLRESRRKLIVTYTADKAKIDAGASRKLLYSRYSDVGLAWDWGLARMVLLVMSLAWPHRI